MQRLVSHVSWGGCEKGSSSFSSFLRSFFSQPLPPHHPVCWTLRPTLMQPLKITSGGVWSVGALVFHERVCSSVELDVGAPLLRWWSSASVLDLCLFTATPSFYSILFRMYSRYSWCENTLLIYRGVAKITNRGLHSLRWFLNCVVPVHLTSLL